MCGYHDWIRTALYGRYAVLEAEDVPLQLQRTARRVAAVVRERQGGNWVRGKMSDLYRRMSRDAGLRSGLTVDPR